MNTAPLENLSCNHSPALVLLSGGMDSTTLLHYVARNLGRSPVHAISYDYGQRHARELECARWQAAAVGAASHRIIHVSFLRDALQGATALIEGGQDVPALDDLDAAQLDQPPTYVPNRNMMLLSIAAACAEAQGIRDVFYGAQASDEYGYWDCTAEFIERLNHVFALNRREAVAVHAPFVSTKKAEILHIGIQLGVDYAHTWSCYRGGEHACGACPTCVERLKAFDTVGKRDPLPYAP